MPTPAPKPFAPPRAKLGLDHRFAEVPAERPKQDQLREKSMVLDQLAREILALDEMTLEEEERRRSHQSSAAGDTPARDGPTTALTSPLVAPPPPTAIFPL